MRSFLCALLALSLSGWSAMAAPPALAQSNAESRYTSLTGCRLVRANEAEDWSVARCPGLGGFSLMLDYGDLREDLRLIGPGRKETRLGINGLGGGGFNSLGKAAEWRGRLRGGRFVPHALIVRTNAVQNPDQPERPTSLLAVIDLDGLCVVALVRPGPQQNRQARDLADGDHAVCLGDPE